MNPTQSHHFIIGERKGCWLDSRPLPCEAAPGGVALTFVCGTTFKSISFAVRQAWNNGDLCGGPAGEVDCIVDVFDVIYLIAYSFAAAFHRPIAAPGRWPAGLRGRVTVSMSHPLLLDTTLGQSEG